jgi:hypothetical protein
VTDAHAKIEAEYMDSTMYEIDFKDGQLYCQSGRNDLYETFELYTKMKKYYEQYCTVTHWKQYTLESGGFVTSHMRVRDAIWQMKERWIEKATFEIDT